MKPIEKVREIHIRYSNSPRTKELPIVTSSREAHTVLLRGYNQHSIGLQEQFVVLYLNNANRVLAIYKASKGGITATVADIRLILTVALKLAATSIILSHNHPSGTMKPSSSDEELTRRIKEGGKLMDIKVLDHLILDPAGNEYFSFADEGLL